MTNVSIPGDADNYVRRECPTCEEQFKWHLGPFNDEAAAAPTPPVYYCPLCGVSAGPDQWWTKEQLEYAQLRAAPALMEQLANETGLHIESTSEMPPTLTEPNDMSIIQSPCHPYEPIKVAVDSRERFHCLVCGEEFAV